MRFQKLSDMSEDGEKEEGREFTGEKENNSDGMSYVDYHWLGIIVDFDTETGRL